VREFPGKNWSKTSVNNVIIERLWGQGLQSESQAVDAQEMCARNKIVSMGRKLCVHSKISQAHINHKEILPMTLVFHALLLEIWENSLDWKPTKEYKFRWGIKLSNRKEKNRCKNGLLPDCRRLYPLTITLYSSKTAQRLIQAAENNSAWRMWFLHS
jgi:hypothetical protein